MEAKRMSYVLNPDGTWRPITPEDLEKIPHDWLASMLEVHRDAYHEHRENDQEEREQ